MYSIKIEFNNGAEKQLKFQSRNEFLNALSICDIFENNLDVDIRAYEDDKEVVYNPYEHSFYKRGFRGKFQDAVRNLETENLKINESSHSNPLIGIRSNMVDTTEGVKYLFFNDINEELCLGGCTNAGCIVEYSIPYDWSDSVEGNIENLFDKINEENPDLIIY